MKKLQVLEFYNYFKFLHIQNLFQMNLEYVKMVLSIHISFYGVRIKCEVQKLKISLLQLF